MIQYKQQNLDNVSFMITFFGIYGFFGQIIEAHSSILYSQDSKIFPSQGPL